jgi:hypothetical protein
MCSHREENSFWLVRALGWVAQPAGQGLSPERLCRRHLDRRRRDLPVWPAGDVQMVDMQTIMGLAGP